MVYVLCVCQSVFFCLCACVCICVCVCVCVLYVGSWGGGEVVFDSRLSGPSSFLAYKKIKKSRL